MSLILAQKMQYRKWGVLKYYIMVEASFTGYEKINRKEVIITVNR